MGSPSRDHAPNTCAATPKSAAPKVVFRVQHPSDGYGPYRPGLSHRWTDLLHEVRNPSILTDFDEAVFSRLSPNRFNGCALESLGAVRKWFSPIEREKLAKLGFALVALAAHSIVARSDRQLLISRTEPFRSGALELPWEVLSSGEVAPEEASPRQVVKPIRDEVQ